MSKPKRSPLEGQATSVSSQDQAASVANDKVAQGTNAQFEGPIENSPYYKALKKTGMESTSDAYQGAKANTRARAATSGFGYDSPVAQGADQQVDAKEASDLANVPTKAMEAAVPATLQASGQTANIASSEGGQGANYFGDATNLEKSYQDALAAQQKAIWGTISGVAEGGLEHLPFM